MADFPGGRDPRQQAESDVHQIRCHVSSTLGPTLRTHLNQARYCTELSGPHPHILYTSILIAGPGVYEGASLFPFSLMYRV